MPGGKLVEAGLGCLLLLLLQLVLLLLLLQLLLLPLLRALVREAPGAVLDHLQHLFLLLKGFAILALACSGLLFLLGFQVTSCFLACLGWFLG